jgi:ABC-type transporter Mla subunit MlaD
MAVAIRRRVPLVLIVVAIVVVAVNATQSGPTHRLQFIVPEATGTIPGERVVLAGETVGSIASTNVTHTGEAHLVLGLENQAWPLPRDTTFILRMGGTIKYTDRYIQIIKGRDRAALAADAIVPARQFIPPVEYDQLFNTFDATTRASLKSFLDNGGATFRAAAQPLRAALGDSAPAVGEANAVVRDVSYDRHALSTLISSTNILLAAVARSDPGLQQLLSGAADTFTATASESQSLRVALRDAPAALTSASRTLVHAGRTLRSIGVLGDRLAPGVTQLREDADPLNGALRAVVSVAPDATTALTTIRQAAPNLETLLTRGRTVLMPRLGSIGAQLAKEVDCIRPYTPELLGMASTWSDFFSAGDGKDKVLHGALGATVMNNATPVDSETLGKLLPSLAIDFPAVPGEVLNQPWYQPQCGITAADEKLAADPEAHTFDPNGGKLVPYQSQ